MTFEEYWKQIEQLNILTNTAIRHLPESFSEKTKVKLMSMTPEEVARIIESAIYDINKGSIETIDTLVRKRL